MTTWFECAAGWVTVWAAGCVTACAEGVMVFERESNVNITAQVGVHYPIRSQYAYSNIARLKKV